MTIELPVTLSYDDWLHGLSARFLPRPMFPKEHVLSIWKAELDETRDWGGLVTTVLHAQSCPDVWITTGHEIAANFLRHEAAGA